MPPGTRTPSGQPITTAPRNQERDLSGATRAAGSVQNSTRINVNGIASAVEGAANELAGAVVAPIANAVQGFSGALSGLAGQGLGFIGSFLGGLLNGFPPFTNELEKFASCNYIFTLGCLTPTELNLPDFTYRLFGPRIVILRSGGAPDKIRTLSEVGGKGEYYIDDVEIYSIITPNRGTKQTDALNFDFKVFEPYSMGMFLETLQVAALRAGYSNYLNAPFLLSLDFVGYDDAGNPTKAINSTRHFPIKMMEVTYAVTEQGSTYSCAAVGFTDSAFGDNAQSAKTDIQITGRTVSEILQSGAQSLTSVINGRNLKLEQSGQISKADKYVIIFPTKNSSLEESILGAKEEDAGATTKEGELREFTDEEKQELAESIGVFQNGQLPADFDQRLESLLGVSITRSEVAETIREYAEKDENINDIGSAKITRSYQDPGNVPAADPAATQLETTPGQICRAQCVIPDELRTFQFPTGKKMQDMIEEVVLASEWGRSITERLDQPDDKNMVDYFKVDAQIYDMIDGATVAETGETPKVYVYRVIPFKVSASRFASPSRPQPNLAALRAQAAKVYNYIYTGKNKDILDFDIKFDNAFFVGIGASRGQGTSTQRVGGQNQMTGTGNNNSSSTVTNPGDQQQTSSSGQASVRETTTTSTGQIGGTGSEPSELQVMRMFNDAMINSPADLLEIELKIWGDPFYLSDAAAGNYVAAPTNFFNITKDGTMDFQRGEVDIILNFRTPFDIGDDGWMDFPGLGLMPVKAFSGLYQVLEIESSFSGGKFEQNLKCIRRRNQESDTNNRGTSQGNSVIQTGANNNQISPNSDGTPGASGSGSSSSGTTRPQSRPTPTSSSANGAGNSAEAQRISNVQQARRNGANVGF